VGRGITSPITTFSFCDSGRVSYCVTASLFGDRIRKFITPDVGVGTDFVKGCAKPLPTSLL
jgi:hypothetical protein